MKQAQQTEENSRLESEAREDKGKQSALPFPVSLNSEYGGERIALAIYLGNLSVAGLLLTLMLWYAMQRQFADPALDTNKLTSVISRTLTLPVFCLAMYR